MFFLQDSGEGAEEVDRVLPSLLGMQFTGSLQHSMNRGWGENGKPHGFTGRQEACSRDFFFFFLTLWFQHYFRKKRSPQKNSLKKYGPVTGYLSVSISVLCVERSTDNSVAVLDCANRESSTDSFLSP